MAKDVEMNWDQFPVAEETEQKTSVKESFARGAAQGVSFNMADEAEAGIKQVFSDIKSVFTGESKPGDVTALERDELGRVKDPTKAPETYKKELQNARAKYAKAQQDNPVAFGAGELGGAIASSFIPGVGGASIGKLAGQGALRAAGSSTETDLSEIAKDAAVGAVTGAAVGVAAKGLGAAAKATGRALKPVLEDVATAPIATAAREQATQASMGKTASVLKSIGKKGDKFDNFFKEATGRFAGTGNEAADKVLEQVIKKGSYAIPGVGKVVALADSASALPGLAQKGAGLTLKALEMAAPTMGKYAPILAQAAKAGGTALLTKHNALAESDEEYVQKLQEIGYLGLDDNQPQVISTNDARKQVRQAFAKPDSLDDFDLAKQGVGKKEVDTLVNLTDNIQKARESGNLAKLYSLSVTAHQAYGKELAEQMISSPELIKQLPLEPSVVTDPDTAAESVLASNFVADVFGSNLKSLKPKLNKTSNPGLIVESLMGDIAKKIDSSLDNSKPVNVDGLTAMVGPGNPKEQYNRILNKISEVTSNPDYASKLLTVKPESEALMQSAPEVAANLQLKAVHALSMIRDLIPKKPGNNTVFDVRREYIPSDQQMSVFKNQLNVIVDPISAINKLSSGKLSKVEVDVLEKLYPNVLNAIRTRVLNQIQKDPKKFSYSQRLAYNRLLGIKSDPSTMPNNIVQLQANYAPIEEQQGVQPVKQPRAAKIDLKNQAGGADGLLKANR